MYLEKTCIKCKKSIQDMDLYKIVMYVIQERLSEHHYEHVECPEKFTV